MADAVDVSLGRETTRALLAGFVFGGLAFAAVMFVQRDRYLRHERGTDFRLYADTPTQLGLFLESERRLVLNPVIAGRVEKRLSAAEITALRDDARDVLGRSAEAGLWLARVTSVSRLKESRPFEVRVRIYFADADRAERIGRMILDEIMIFETRKRMEAGTAEFERLHGQLAVLREDSPEVPALRQRLREASMAGTGMSLQHVLKINRFPAASAGRVVVWRCLAESAGLAVGIASIVAAVAGWFVRLRTPRSASSSAG